MTGTLLTGRDIRAVVRTANAAGTKVTVELPDGSLIAGTARWDQPADAAAGRLLPGSVLWLFGANSYRGPWTSEGPNAYNNAGYTVTPANTTSAIPIPLSEIIAAVATASGDIDLLPWQTNAADSTLGTRLGIPDRTWRFGTGLE